MLYDGQWKLSKYTTGDIHLFDMENDAQEQHNRAADPTCAERLAAMDGELTQEIMRSIIAANDEKAVDLGTGLWDSDQYGREGRERC
jgi:arylsulfatase A-like enzyme